MIDWIGQQGHDALNYVIAIIEWIALTLLLLAGKTSKWFPPFNGLSEPFQLVSEGLTEAKWRVIDFRNHYDDVIAAINSILDTSGLETLIERLFSEWNSFRGDPKGYISGKMYELLDTWGSLKDDAKRWVIYRIQEYDWYAWEWLTRPIDSMRSWIQADYPLFYTLLTDTAEGFRQALEAVSHQAYLLVTDPVTYLKDWFVDSLGWSGEFWEDPWRYLFSQILESIERRIDEWKPELTQRGERIIRFLWEGRL